MRPRANRVKKSGGQKNLSLRFCLSVILTLFVTGCTGLTSANNSNSSPSSPSAAPTVSIPSPATGATATGVVSVTTSVSSNTTSVQFKVDGNNSGAAVTTAPFSLSLNTAALSNGEHSLTHVSRN